MRAARASAHACTFESAPATEAQAERVRELLRHHPLETRPLPCDEEPRRQREVRRSDVAGLERGAPAARLLARFGTPLRVRRYRDGFEVLYLVGGDGSTDSFTFRFGRDQKLDGVPQATDTN